MPPSRHPFPCPFTVVSKPNLRTSEARMCPADTSLPVTTVGHQQHQTTPTHLRIGSSTLGHRRADSCWGTSTTSSGSSTAHHCTSAALAVCCIMPAHQVGKHRGQLCLLLPCDSNVCSDLLPGNGTNKAHQLHKMQACTHRHAEVCYALGARGEPGRGCRSHKFSKACCPVAREKPRLPVYLGQLMQFPRRRQVARGTT
jgi:hypothetical protein